VSLLLDQQTTGLWDFGDMPNVSMTEYGDRRTAPLNLRAAQRRVREVVEL
jgi:hypothetical protein